MDKLITDNSVETLKIAYGEERFGIIHLRKDNDVGRTTEVIILNHREAKEIHKEIADFIKENHER